MEKLEWNRVKIRESGFHGTHNYTNFELFNVIELYEVFK